MAPFKAEFFEKLASQCTSDEERDALVALVETRRREEERWKEAKGGGASLNEATFPKGQLPAPSLDFPKWWDGSEEDAAAAGNAPPAVDANEVTFPLRHFEAVVGEGGESSVETAVEVPTSASSLRPDNQIEGGDNAWVGNPAVPSEGSWPQPPPEDKLTEAELKFLEEFWSSKSALKQTGSKKERPEFVVDIGGEVAAAEADAGVIALDLTTPEQEAVLAQRAKAGLLSPQARQKKTEKLAQHFQAREKEKAAAGTGESSSAEEAAAKPTQPSGPARTANPVSAPPPAFFEEKLEVFTAEDVPKAIAKYKEQEAAVIDKRAAEGAKFTSFGSPSAKGAAEGTEDASSAADAGSVLAASGMLEAGSAFPFKSPQAKGKVDAILGRRAADVERIRQQQKARNDARSNNNSGSDGSLAPEDSASPSPDVPVTKD